MRILNCFSKLCLLFMPKCYYYQAQKRTNCYNVNVYMQLYSVSLAKSLNHVISKIRQIGKKKSVSFFDAYPFVCHLQYNKWESCSSSAKKYTWGSFLDKISNGCLKNGNSLASAWHNPTVSRCRVTETPGASGRGDYVTIRCKPTDFYAMWLKIDFWTFFFLPFFFQSALFWKLEYLVI